VDGMLAGAAGDFEDGALGGEDLVQDGEDGVAVAIGSGGVLAVIWAHGGCLGEIALD
jgi:hypothetical protein